MEKTQHRTGCHIRWIAEWYLGTLKYQYNGNDEAVGNGQGCIELFKGKIYMVNFGRRDNGTHRTVCWTHAARSGLEWEVWLKRSSLRKMLELSLDKLAMSYLRFLSLWCQSFRYSVAVGVWNSGVTRNSSGIGNIVLGLTMVHLRRGSQDGRRRGLFCFWVKSTNHGVPDLDSSFPADMGNQRIECGVAFGTRDCIASAPSVSRCVGIVEIGEPGESPER